MRVSRYVYRERTVRMSPFVLMFCLSPSYEIYRCQDTPDEYRDTASHENRRVNVSIGVRCECMLNVYHARILA